MLKLGWAAATADSIWAEWFRARYFKVSFTWSQGNPIRGSCIWRRLRTLSPFLQQGNKWTVGNGLSISLWYDHWLDNHTISSRFPNIQFSPLDRVSEIIHDNSWNIPPNLLAQLQEFLLHSTDDIMVADSPFPDLLSRMDSPSGILTLKSAWHLLRLRANSLPWIILIQNKFVNPRLAVFSWLLLHRKTPIESVANWLPLSCLGFWLLAVYSNQPLPQLLLFGMLSPQEEMSLEDNWLLLSFSMPSPSFGSSIMTPSIITGSLLLSVPR